MASASTNIRAELEGKTPHLLDFTSKSSYRSDRRESNAQTSDSGQGDSASSGSTTVSDDSAANESGDAEDDADNAEDENGDNKALSRGKTGLGLGKGKGKGKGKGPGIRVHHAATPDAEPPSTPIRVAGLKIDTSVGSSPLKRKRRESNVSVLDDDCDPLSTTYPRNKILKGLKQTNEGLLAYEDTEKALDDTEMQDDDDYDAVNNISESEDDDESEAEKREELFIKNTFGRRGSINSIASDVLQEFLEQKLNEDYNAAGEAFFGSAYDFTKNDRKLSDGSAKRVRFRDEVEIEAFDNSSMSGSSTDSEDLDTFPDIFVEQDQIPAQLLEDPQSDSDNSYWDFNEEDRSTSLLLLPEDEGEETESDAGSSGYETDNDGDTTDEEEMPPPALPHTAPSVLQRPSSAASSAVASPSPFRRNARPSKRKGPILGSFEVDPLKVIAYVDPTGRNLTFEPPQIPNVASAYFPQHFPASSSNSIANSSPRTSMVAPMMDESDFSETSQQVNADIMFGGLLGSLNGAGFNFNAGMVGPVEAFIPMIDSDAQMMDEMNGVTESEFENEESMIEEFFNFEDTDSDNEEDDDDEDTVGPFSTPSGPAREEISSTRNMGDSILEHLDRSRGAVTAFRNNQHRSRNIAQLPADPDLRASVTKPVRSGKSAEAPITPLRKRGSSLRNNRDTALNSSPLVDRAGAAITKRRVPPRMGTFA